jgi:hypothetical protein
LRKVLYAIAFALAAVGLANASAPVAPCLNCTYTAMYNKAVSKGAGSWMIWNPANGEIHKWTVTCGIPPIAAGASTPGGTKSVDQIQTVCTGQETAVTQEMHDTATNLSSVYNLTAHTYKAGVTVPGDSWHFAGLPPGNVGSAHDYVTNANYRAQLNDKLDQYALDFALGTPIVAPMQYILAHADAALGFSTGVMIVVTVTYPDGTHFKIDIKLVGAPEYEQGSARDDTGQLIPDADVQGNAGNWTYGSGDHVARDRLVGTMRQLGFWFPPALPPNYSTVTCTWDAANNRLSCIVSN